MSPALQGGRHSALVTCRRQKAIVSPSSSESRLGLASRAGEDRGDTSRGLSVLSFSPRYLSVGPAAEENLTITGQMQAMLTGTDLLLAEIRFRHPFGSSRNDRSVFNG